MIPYRLYARRPLRFGSRGSALAIEQSRLAVERFLDRYPGAEVEIVPIDTVGDRDKTSALAVIGGRGVFTNALEAAVVAGDVDAAVHSAKDLPTRLHPMAPLSALPLRDDPRDVLVSRHGLTLDQLPRNPVIGTSSRRRAVQIIRLRPDAKIMNIRGNVDTRLRKAELPEFDAIVLAAAGLHRLGWCERVCQYFAVDEIVPSPGQGAIAIQALRGTDVAAMVESIDDPAVSTPVTIERSFLRAMGVGCTYPVGAYVSALSTGYRLVAMAANESGDRVATVEELLTSGDEHAHAMAIAARLRREIDESPMSVVSDAFGAAHDLAGARVLVTRPRRQAAPLSAALRARGARPVLLPTIRVAAIADTGKLAAALRDAGRGRFDWIVFTSANAVEAIARHAGALDSVRGVKVAVVGAATAAAATAAGLTVDLAPAIATAEDLAADMARRVRPGSRVLYPRSAIGGDGLPRALRSVGIEVEPVAVYHTLPETDVDPDALEQLQQRAVDVILFASPSSVDGLLRLVGGPGSGLSDIPVVCAGPVTGHAAREAGFDVVAISVDPGPEAVVDAVSRYWRTRPCRDAVEETESPREMPVSYALGRSQE